MKIKVTFETELPEPDMEDEDIQEWLEYQLGARGGMNIDNRLNPYDICNSDSVIFDET